jgi:SAM-dependent methyltransferase
VLRESDGIIHLLTDKQSAEFDAFLDAYEQVRSDEQWGGDDLDLPFHPKRHRDIWDIRQRTFRELESVARSLQRGIALDIGAGNCWLTRYLDRWGFDAIALDIHMGGADGLRAGQKFIDQGARFLRVHSGMEVLPFVSGSITLLVTNASFHYASDFRAALSEFERVLTPGGTIVIMDTPVYKREADGELMMSERADDFERKYRIPKSSARRGRFLTFSDVEPLVRSLNLRLRVHRVWPGWRRTYESIRAGILGRRLAQFPLMVIGKR